MKEIWTKHSLKHVMEYFVAGYNKQDDPPIIEYYDWWIDPTKNEVVILLCVKNR